MIDLKTERLLTLHQASDLLPGRPSPATLWRWRNKGVRGRKLESVVLGGQVYTSVEAIGRFALQHGSNESRTIRTPRQRERAISSAERELQLCKQPRSTNAQSISRRAIAEYAALPGETSTDV